MNKLLAPFDREFNQVVETINTQSRLDIMLLEKSLIERKFCSNRSQNQLSGSKKNTDCGD